ncbi:hypothetical protein AB0D59_01965 [Streptomyces sp. NPDC048417]|uniref:hypothetical protein n=1 Tax=Streptomyces sp. NPDC048417 TaxID=3155387 RepID=UPI0034438D6B
MPYLAHNPENRRGSDVTVGSNDQRVRPTRGQAGDAGHGPFSSAIAASIIRFEVCC